MSLTTLKKAELLDTARPLPEKTLANSTSPTIPTIPKPNPSTASKPPAQVPKKPAIPRLRKLKWIAAVLVLAGLALFFMRNSLLGTPTRVVVASQGELIQSVVASGRVASPERSTVALQNTGRVVRVAVVEGQAVKAGQLLIALESSDNQASLAQATAQVAQAQARLRQQGEVSAPLALQTLAQAQALALQTRKALERSRELLAQGFISQTAVDDAQRAYAVATSQVASAQAQVKSNTPGGSDAALAKAALVQAQAGEQLAKAKLAQGQVVAATDGVVISRSVEVGDIVQPGKALMVLAAGGPTQILVQIDEKNLSKIALGQKAYASADAFAKERFDAVVAFINLGVDASRGSVQVKLTVKNPPAYLRQDMTVSVDIETARRTAAVVIPINTLAEASSEKPWVLVVRDNRVVKQFVKLGLRGDARVEVLEGIKAGESVVPVSKTGVKEGQRVRVTAINVPSPVP